MSLPVTQETPAYLTLSFIEDVVSRPGLERRRFGFEKRRMGISKQVPQLLLPILLPLLSSQTIRDLRESWSSSCVGSAQEAPEEWQPNYVTPVIISLSAQRQMGWTERLETFLAREY